MRYIKILPFCVLALAFSLPVAAAHGRDESISVEVIDDYGRAFARYPLWEESSGKLTRAYLEAQPQASYAIRVRNNTPNRVGLVIAVDGRNIISGKKSKLKRNEKMYVLGPWQSATYDGWRTDRNRINEFFFTREIDSYAGAFGDYSAMGVIAVAAYRDRAYRPPRYWSREVEPRYNHDDSAKSRAGPLAGKQSRRAEESAPGTGFGDEHWSPSVQVHFDSERRSFHKVFLKYEWRETLCEMGISRCYAQRHNRFWKDDRYSDRRGFAPYPPGYRRADRDDFVNNRRYR